ncbi:hypothetical protein NPIL_379171 [Nephila pilipes]|uniref:Uncharacterized protein n=1 Tax=Nephila pilipes TaxID=299642 RepID=A0A8X6MYP6_NEPPI|nr:hypothetical protein NPIL_379171 [Nephila pilipes]
MCALLEKMSNSFSRSASVGQSPESVGMLSEEECTEQAVAFRRCDVLGRWDDGGWTNYSECETLDVLQEDEKNAPSAVSALVLAVSLLSLVSLCAALFIFTAFR